MTALSPTPPTFEPLPAEAFAEGLLEKINHAALVLMISIGHRTGLFDALDDFDWTTSPQLAEAAGLKVDNGIVVDEFARTEDADIVAAGDCTNHPNGLYNMRLRLESVPNASEQAKSAAASICGKEKLYNTLPWFWSDQYDLKLQIAGLSQGYDQVVIRGDKDNSRSFAAFYLKEGKLIAADCVNRPQEFMVSKQIIAQGKSVDPARLADESIKPKEMAG